MAALYRSEPVCASSCLFHVTVWHLSVTDCFVHMETSQLPAQCNLSVVQHFSPLSLPSHITACVGLKARCTIFIYSPNLHITFHCYNDKPVLSPHGVIKLHLVFFLLPWQQRSLTFPSLWWTWQLCIEKLHLQRELRFLWTTVDLPNGVFVGHSELEESCYRAIVCWQPEQDVCIWTGRGACGFTYVYIW